ncbi:hypothetical protein [Natrialba taiwanensis]|uniref:Uncharacterized protein n=1 Tax=Natrialba taiwanensis DSM 12281 TaxID=1230458 RepID=L9ZMZ5_9EURY|nr:hypothetical protein [Natrialba taiwanensis]ELY86498.1 hypothetical protein C484_18132 [Natrialba taiwanensis DSM 12281]
MWLLDVGIDPVGINHLWEDEAGFVIDVNPALGDAFALATAAELDATLIVVVMTTTTMSRTSLYTGSETVAVREQPQMERG